MSYVLSVLKDYFFMLLIWSILIVVLDFILTKFLFDVCKNFSCDEFVDFLYPICVYGKHFMTSAMVPALFGILAIGKQEFHKLSVKDNWETFIKINHFITELSSGTIKGDEYKGVKKQKGGVLTFSSDITNLNELNKDEYSIHNVLIDDNKCNDFTKRFSDFLDSIAFKFDNRIYNCLYDILIIVKSYAQYKKHIVTTFEKELKRLENKKVVSTKKVDKLKTNFIFYLIGGLSEQFKDAIALPMAALYSMLNDYDNGLYCQTLFRIDMSDDKTDSKLIITPNENVVIKKRTLKRMQRFINLFCFITKYKKKSVAEQSKLKDDLVQLLKKIFPKVENLSVIKYKKTLPENLKMTPIMGNEELIQNNNRVKRLCLQENYSKLCEATKGAMIKTFEGESDYVKRNINLENILSSNEICFLGLFYITATSEEGIKVVTEMIEELKNDNEWYETNEKNN